MNKQVLFLAGALVVSINGSAAWAEDTSLWQKMLDAGQQAFDAGKYSKAARSWNKVVEMLKQTSEDAADKIKERIMLAGCLKHLGDCHRMRQRWQEAGTCYNDSLSAYEKLTADTPEVQAGLLDLSSCYKSIGVDTLGQEASKMLKKAGAVGLSSFKTVDGDHYELALADIYSEEVNENRIERVRFNKRICFDFVQTPEGKLNVSKIKGIELKADVCWVEPKSTIMYLDEKGETTAEVTVDAMGFMKTVTVNPPRKIYDYIVELVKHVNTGAVVASGSTPPVTTPSVVPASVTSAGSTQASSVVPAIDIQPAESSTPSDKTIDSGKEAESVSK